METERKIICPGCHSENLDREAMYRGSAPASIPVIVDRSEGQTRASEVASFVSA